MTDQRKGNCECGTPGCVDEMGNPGRYGLLGRPDRNGRRHVRGCKDTGCRVCLGRHSRRSGARKQSKAVTALGIPRSSLSPGHEEFLGGTIRTEVKSGAQVGPIETRYSAAEKQSEAQRPFGDHRPFCMVAMPKGTSDGLVLVRLSVLHEFAAALIEQWSKEP